MAKQSKSFGSERAYKAHLLLAGGLAGEVRDLRNDAEEGFQNSEARAGFPHLDWLDVTTGAPTAAGGDLKLLGRNLLQGQTFDTLTTGLTTAGFVVTCLKPGNSGISVVVVQGAGALSAVRAANVLTITLAAAGSTATQVVAAINGAASCIGVLFAAVLSVGGGTVLVAASNTLKGGVGLYAGNKVWVSGVEALPKHAASQWTDDYVIVTVPALTGLSPARAAGDLVNMMISSDGVCSEALTGVLA